MNKPSFTSLADLRAFIGGAPHITDPKVPALEASIGDIDQSAIFAHIEGRDAYLEWVSAYKSWIAQADDYIRIQKKLMRDPQGESNWLAQSNASDAARCVTVAIRMRRLAKRWSYAKKCEIASPETANAA